MLSTDPSTQVWALNQALEVAKRHAVVPHPATYDPLFLAPFFGEYKVFFVNGQAGKYTRHNCPENKT